MILNISRSKFYKTFRKSNSKRLTGLNSYLSSFLSDKYSEVESLFFPAHFMLVPPKPKVPEPGDFVVSFEKLNLPIEPYERNVALGLGLLPDKNKGLLSSSNLIVPLKQIRRSIILGQDVDLNLYNNLLKIVEVHYSVNSSIMLEDWASQVYKNYVNAYDQFFKDLPEYIDNRLKILNISKKFSRWRLYTHGPAHLSDFFANVTFEDDLQTHFSSSYFHSRNYGKNKVPLEPFVFEKFSDYSLFKGLKKRFDTYGLSFSRFDDFFDKPSFLLEDFYQSHDFFDLYESNFWVKKSKRLDPVARRKARLAEIRRKKKIEFIKNYFPYLFKTNQRKAIRHNFNFSKSIALNFFNNNLSNNNG